MIEFLVLGALAAACVALMARPSSPKAGAQIPILPGQTSSRPKYQPARDDRAPYLGPYKAHALAIGAHLLAGRSDRVRLSEAQLVNAGVIAMVFSSEAVVDQLGRRLPISDRHIKAAIANAYRESRLMNGEESPLPERSFGLFMINTGANLGRGLTQAQLVDPFFNARTILRDYAVPAWLQRTGSLQDLAADFAATVERPGNKPLEAQRSREWASLLFPGQ